MLYCFVNETVLFEPETCAAVEVGHDSRRHTAYETFPQHLRKQMMVAIPLAVIVQRYQKQISALKLIQDKLAIGLGVGS
jgi:hypothetical protein